MATRMAKITEKATTGPSKRPFVITLQYFLLFLLWSCKNQFFGVVRELTVQIHKMFGARYPRKKEKKNQLRPIGIN